ncbi:hypothetical protein GQ44DRAFT_771158 [Phaeosphaeriaceae sp. PMI808]|nr:hypothetical protein GQ44DRAFT_771158 [Phaeosphaeriaceae sp. PMI808]
MGIDLTIVTTTLTLAIISERLARRHYVHRLLWTTCAHRTNTSYQSRFERLERFWSPMRSIVRPNETDVVTFDFTPCPTHTQPDGCNDITTLSGRWFVGSATWTTPGPAPPEKPGHWTSMGKLYPKGDAATARVSGTVASRVLDHLLCNLVQDAEVYFYLCTTPAWIRALYVVTWSASRVREILILRLLWVQMRAALHVHDFIEDPWSPPSWVYRFEERMRLIKSRAISGLNYWLGKNMLGMGVRYQEYVPI